MPATFLRNEDVDDTPDIELSQDLVDYLHAIVLEGSGPPFYNPREHTQEAIWFNQGAHWLIQEVAERLADKLFTDKGNDNV